MAESTVKIIFLGDSSKLKRELDDVDGSTSKAESGFGKLGAAIGGALAVGSVVSLGKGAFDAAIESQKIAAQTEAVIKSTGAAAGITADEIGAMASAMSKKNAVDDEAIQTGQNLLLTFTNIGKTDKIFERTTQASIDMAAAMGTDVKSAAMQLGKALNDPADGLSKLTRAGIQFTDEQKKQIQTMQAAGDMAGAQAVMLGELERQFGGSAEAQATASDRMGIAFGNLQEQIGARLIPVMERFSAWVVEVGIPALERFAGWMQDNVVPAVQAMADGIATVVSFLSDWWREHWDQIRETAATVIENVRAVIETVLGAIEAFWRTWGGTITAYLQGVFDALRQIVQGAMDVIRGIIDVVMGLIRGDFSRVWDGIQAIFSGVWQAINGLVDLAINEVRTRIEIVMRLIAGVFDEIWNQIVGAVRAAWDAILGLISSAAGSIQGLLFDIFGYFVGLGTGIANVVSAIGSTLAGWVNEVWKYGGMVLDFFAEIPGKIGDFFGGLAEAIISPFRSAFNAIAGLWNRTVGSLSFSIPSWVPGIGGNGWDVPDIPTFHTGGIVPGSGDVLSLLKGGEGVFTREQMAALGGRGAQVINVGPFVFNAPVTSADAHHIGDTVQRTLMSNQLRVALAGA